MLLICFGACFVSSSQEVVKKKVAVYMTGSDIEESYKKVIGAKLVSAITQSGEYAAVERTADFLAALSAETDYQTSGEVRDSQIASLGQKFGVKYVIVADVSELFEELFISSRLINVETGLVEESYDANGPAESMSQLINLSKQVADGLIILPKQRLREEAEAKLDNEAKAILDRMQVSYISKASNMAFVNGNVLAPYYHFWPNMKELIEQPPNIKKFLNYPVIIELGVNYYANNYTVLYQNGQTRNFVAKLNYEKGIWTNFEWRCIQDDEIGAYFYYYD